METQIHGLLTIWVAGCSAIMPTVKFKTSTKIILSISKKSVKKKCFTETQRANAKGLLTKVNSDVSNSNSLALSQLLLLNLETSDGRQFLTISIKWPNVFWGRFDHKGTIE